MANMCYTVSIIVKYYLTNPKKYGIIVVLRRKRLLSNKRYKKLNYIKLLSITSKFNLEEEKQLRSLV
jgi:hypothetical protein